MIALFGPIAVPQGASTGSPWPAVLLLAVFVAVVVLVAAWDRIRWTRKPAEGEHVPETTTYPKAA
jgi:type VI protein secretion system component VasK